MLNTLGIDTSNYTTSAAVYNNGKIAQRKMLLPVKKGELGLRQSDAVFHHVQQLPLVSGALIRVNCLTFGFGRISERKN